MRWTVRNWYAPVIASTLNAKGEHCTLCEMLRHTTLNIYIYILPTSRARRIEIRMCVLYYYFPWRYSPNLGLGLPPRNSLFHLGFLDLRQLVGLLGRAISSSQGLYLYTNTEKRTHTYTQTLNINALSGIRTNDPIPASERAKTVHALDRSVTVTNNILYS
jgi:hypothetical protein